MVSEWIVKHSLQVTSLACLHLWTSRKQEDPVNWRDLLENFQPAVCTYLFILFFFSLSLSLSGKQKVFLGNWACTNRGLIWLVSKLKNRYMVCNAVHHTLQKKRYAVGFLQTFIMQQNNKECQKHKELFAFTQPPCIILPYSLLCLTVVYEHRLIGIYRCFRLRGFSNNFLLLVKPYN